MPDVGYQVSDFANMCSHVDSRTTMNPSILLIIGSLLLTACAQTPKLPEPAPTPVPSPHVEVEPVLPDVELSGELLYEFLLTEIAGQRGHKALAMEGSLDIARKTRDPRMARRAAQLAFDSGDMQKSIAAFRQWQEIEPTAPLAARMLASILLRGGQLDEAQLELAKLLEAEKANPASSFMQAFQLVSSHPDKRAALKLMRDLAQPYAQVAEAHWSVAQLARQAGDTPLALSEVRQARSLRPAWDMAASLEAQLLQKDAPQQALEVLRRYRSDYPDAREIRLQYARALLEKNTPALAPNLAGQRQPGKPGHGIAIAGFPCS
jgi:predicted Zn-dependent protease